AGGFAAPTVLLPGWAINVALGHMDAGDALDLVTTTGNGPSPAVMLRLGDGAGGFGPEVQVKLPHDADGLAVGDFDNDGDDDVAASSSLFDTLWILLSNGTGGLVLAGSKSTGDSPSGLSAGDIDEDGDLDLLTPIASKITVLTGDGAGGFTPSTLPTPPTPDELVLADLDLDG